MFNIFNLSLQSWDYVVGAILYLILLLLLSFYGVIKEVFNMHQPLLCSH